MPGLVQLPLCNVLETDNFIHPFWRFPHGNWSSMSHTALLHTYRGSRNFKTVHRYTVSVMVLLLLHMVIVLFIVRCVHEQSSMSIVTVGLSSSLSLSLSVSLFTCSPSSPPSEELNSLMAQGTKEFFSLFVQLFGRSSLSLSHLLQLLMIVCRGWLALSMMPRSLLRVLLSASVTRGSSFMPTTEPASLTSFSNL